MASALVKINVHIVFHIKSNGIRMRENDLKRIFSYIGGIINGIGGVTMDVGGVVDHIHIVASLPKTKSLSDFVKTIKSDSCRWIKPLIHIMPSLHGKKDMEHSLLVRACLTKQ